MFRRVRTAIHRLVPRQGQEAETASWNRWVGKRAALLEAIEVAASQLSAWYGTDPMYAVTSEMGERSSTTTSLDEVQRLRASALRGLRRMDIRLHREGVPEEVIFTLRPRAPVLAVEVAGDDRTQVVGLKERIGSLLEPHAGKPRWYKRVHALAGLVPGLLISGGVNLIVPSLAPPVVWGGAHLGVVLLAAFIYLLTPDLQLLGPDEQPRFRRFRRLAATALGLYSTTLGIYSFYFRD